MSDLGVISEFLPTDGRLEAEELTRTTEELAIDDEKEPRSVESSVAALLMFPVSGGPARFGL